MKRKCLTAAKVLPPELLEQVQQYARGCYLWVATTSKEQHRRRNAEIVHLYYEEGRSTLEIARQEYITPRRVRQILVEWRRKNNQA